MVDLAVCAEGFARVINAYGSVDFEPLSDNDPVLMAQNGDSLEEKRANGYIHMYRRYLQTYAKYHQLMPRFGCTKYTTDWFEGNMDKLGMLLMRLGSQGISLGDEGSSITF